MPSPNSCNPSPGDTDGALCAPNDARRLEAVLADLLDAGHEIRVKVTGRSMHPAVRDGDTVVISRPSPFRPRRGDLVFYRMGPGGALVLHRLVGLKRVRGSLSPVCLTKGDSLTFADEPFESDRIVGLVTRIERRGPGGAQVLLMEGAGARLRGYVAVLLARTRLLAEGLAQRLLDAAVKRGNTGGG